MKYTIEDNESLVYRYAQAVIDGDMQTIEALQHPDVQWWALGHQTTPTQTAPTIEIPLSLDSGSSG
jgi:ketosteroid isomerase-like protein